MNSPGNRHRPLDFLIIGAQKSATTWAQFVLRHHPDIYLPRHETRVFEDPIYSAGELDKLASEIARAPVSAKVGIKRPEYLCRPECPPRIAEHSPNAKLVALLRNPIERAISAYFHIVRSGKIEPGTPDRVFQSLLRGDYEPKFAMSILTYGRYGEAIERYYRSFPREQLLLVLDRDLAKDERGVYRRICAHLGVSVDHVPWDISIPRNRGLYNGPLLNVASALNRSRISFDPVSGLTHIRDSRLASVAKAAAVFVHRLNSALSMLVDRPDDTLSAAMRAQLRDYYAEDIARTEKLTGFDLSAWLA